MSYSKETQTMKSIVFDKELEAKIKAMAKEARRSYNAQVNYMLEQYIKLKES